MDTELKERLDAIEAKIDKFMALLPTPVTQHLFPKQGTGGYGGANPTTTIEISQKQWEQMTSGQMYGVGGAIPANQHRVQYIVVDEKTNTCSGAVTSQNFTVGNANG